GLIGGTLAILVHTQLEFWHTAQPESFGGMMTAWAIVLATFEADWTYRRARIRQFAAWVAAGALYAFAGLLKPPLAGGALITAIFIAARTRKRLVPFVAMGIGGVATIAACALWFVARGAFRDLYETLFVFTPHYTELGWEGVGFPGLMYLALEEW